MEQIAMEAYAIFLGKSRRTRIIPVARKIGRVMKRSLSFGRLIFKVKSEINGRGFPRRRNISSTAYTAVTMHRAVTAKALLVASARTGMKIADAWTNAL
jgi:hypothetical protein